MPSLTRPARPGTLRLSAALAAITLVAATCQGPFGTAYGSAETVRLVPNEAIDRTIVVAVPADVVGQLRSAELELSVDAFGGRFPPVVFSLGEGIDESVTVDDPGPVDYRFDVMDWLGSCIPDECAIRIPLTISNEGDGEAEFMWSADIGVLTEHESPGLGDLTICVAELEAECEG